MSETREQLIQRLKAKREEIAQYFRDADHWNRTHPNEVPIDADPDGQLAGLAVSLDQAIGIPAQMRATTP